MIGKRKAPPSNRVTTGPKRRRTSATVTEVTFDPDARADYLTGFHKRKLHRQQQAQQAAVARAREERLKLRRIAREERKADLQRHVEAVNAALADPTQFTRDSDGSDSADQGNGDDWAGLEEPDAADREEAYLDEDRHTVVTIEEVQVSRSGLVPRAPLGEAAGGSADSDSGDQAGKADDAVTTPGRKAVQSQATKPETTARRRKKFRYESKGERKLTRMKERASGRSQAKQRRAKTGSRKPK